VLKERDNLSPIWTTGIIFLSTLSPRKKNNFLIKKKTNACNGEMTHKNRKDVVSISARLGRATG
jgi:hypothetical protein